MKNISTKNLQNNLCDVKFLSIIYFIFTTLQYFCLLVFEIKYEENYTDIFFYLKLFLSYLLCITHFIIIHKHETFFKKQLIIKIIIIVANVYLLMFFKAIFWMAILSMLMIRCME